VRRLGDDFGQAHGGFLGRGEAGHLASSHQRCAVGGLGVTQGRHAVTDRAETYMREGRWPEATEISGIECAGLVKADPDGQLAAGQ